VKRYLAILALLASLAGAAEVTSAPELESQVSAVVAGSQLTIVHFWAPWCPNCNSELKNGEWTKFVAAHPDIKVIFITTWNDKQGSDLLAKYGLGTQANFTSYLHPNHSKKREDKMSTFMGLPVTWIPSTWIFKDGKLRYALNYGEIHFDMLQQLVDDSTNAWKH